MCDTIKMNNVETIQRRKRNALYPDIRDQWCEHDHAPYRGKTPCTGPLKCSMCDLLLDPDTREPLPNQDSDN